MVIAGPGTGKTRTLTHRIAWQITAHGIAPRRFLALTFTRRAAGEMQHRLASLLPGGGSGPAGPAADILVTTFHGLALRLLGEHRDQAWRASASAWPTRQPGSRRPRTSPVLSAMAAG